MSLWDTTHKSQNYSLQIFTHTTYQYLHTTLQYVTMLSEEKKSIYTYTLTSSCTHVTLDKRICKYFTSEYA